MKLNCIAIDDEPLALELVCTFIRQTLFLSLSGAYGSATAAMEALKMQDVDLVFLDIHMPKLNGMDIARFLNQNNDGIRIIFTTAYKQFAFDSYKVDALDYLLKPFEYDDFLKAANKALTYYQLVNQVKADTSTGLDAYIFVRVGYQSVKILLDQIKYIEGQKDYVKIHLKGFVSPILTLSTLKSLEEKLPADRFMRIQRSFIVALDVITAVTKSSIWIDDMEITIGDRYKGMVQNAMIYGLKHI